ncbi:TPA: fatty acid desaturase [Pseudomonas aeruginosa]|nr:fatty acid desaturase [Pseudomonas aeruginosa]
MAHYLCERQSRLVKRLLRTPMARTEWPTWLLIAFVHTSWWGLVLNYQALGAWLTLPPLIVISALYMSLQHELIHGHPTPWAKFNALLGYLPLAIWCPYPLYRDSHLKHHEDEQLTFPDIDPESRYVTRRQWPELTGWHQRLLRWNKTLAGRVALGPLLSIIKMSRVAIRQSLANEGQSRLDWSLHLLLCVALLTSMQYFADLPAWLYLLAVAYPAFGLSMVRSFYEHRPAEIPAQRCVLNEDRGPMRWLFLNNSLHLVHHDLPGLPWYLLPRVYRASRRRYRQRNGEFVFESYMSIAQRHLFRPIDDPVHPFR